MIARPRSHRASARVLVATLVPLLLAHARSVLAEPAREAVVVRSAQDEPDAQAALRVDELLARVTGELAAAGFRVSVRQLASGRATDAGDVTLGAEQVAAVLLGEPPRDATESVRCVVLDSLRGALALTEIRVQTGPDATHRLALQVADLLRAKLAEQALHDEPAPVEPPSPEPAVAPPLAVAPSAPAWALELELGALALIRPGEWDTAVAPSLAVVARQHTHGPRLGARASLAGYGSDVRRSAEGGSLTARQGLGLVEAVLAYASHSALTPELSAGLGVYGLGAHGASDEPDRAHSHVLLTPVAAAGAGVALALGERVTLGARGQLCYATHKLSLRIADEEVARSGGSMLGLTALLRVALR